ncbi:hypothetical protein A7X67_13090 [Clostridium sp. W14A]|nr:hypothetical protein A7X67_13090 [Clostridium sp. W14A]
MVIKVKNLLHRLCTVYAEIFTELKIKSKKSFQSSKRNVLKRNSIWNDATLFAVLFLLVLIHSNFNPGNFFEPAEKTAPLSIYAATLLCGAAGVAIRFPGLINRLHGDNRFDRLRFFILAVPGFLVLLQPLAAVGLSFPFVLKVNVLGPLGFWTCIVFLDCMKGKPNHKEEGIR